MMSENSSQVEKKKTKVYDSMDQRSILARRKWVAVISVLSCLLIYPVGSLIAFISAINLNLYSGIPVNVRLVNTFNMMLSGNIFGFGSAILLAVLAATQGFSYLFNRVTVDFYESSPHTKAKRFASIYINGLLIYYIPITVSFVLSFFSAALMGAMDPVMIPQGLVQLMELILLYTAVYSISTVASMLSGNILIALLLNGVFLLIEDMIHISASAVCATYFATWYGGSTEEMKHFLSPIVLYFRTHEPSFYSEGQQVTLTLVKSHIMRSYVDDIQLVIFFIIFTAVAFLLYKKRPVESAGRLFVYAPVGYVVKIMGAVLVSLFTAIILENLTAGDVWVVIIGVIVCAALFCTLFQTMLIDGNVKKKLYHIPVSALLIIAVVIVCRFDLIGFENYIPSENSVESCAIASYDNNVSHFEKNEYGVYEEQYDCSGILNKMNLRNVSDVMELARVGQRIKSEEDRSYNGFAKSYMQDFEEDEDVSYTDGWNYVVLYKLKSGKKVYRVIRIPVDTDTDLMDRITTSAEYRSAMLQSDDDFVNALMAASDHHKLGFYNGCRESEKIDGAFIREFISAYEKDINEKYSYSLSRFKCPAGFVQYNMDDDYYDYTFGQTYYLSYPVFEDYENTVAFLRQHDIYFEETLPLDVIECLRVNEVDEDGNEEPREYTSSEEIAELMSRLYGDSGMWEWQPPNLIDYSRSVDVFTKKEVYGDEYFRGETYTMYFLNEDEEDSSLRSE